MENVSWLIPLFNLMLWEFGMKNSIKSRNYDVVKYKMKSCNDGRNVSNDGGDDAYDPLVATITFL